MRGSGRPSVNVAGAGVLIAGFVTGLVPSGAVAALLWRVMM